MVDENHKMRLLDKEESWHLLSDMIFAKESCPPELEKAGKKIAERCDGLPLLIVTVADLLSKVERTQTYWNELVEKEHSVFMNALNKVIERVFPRYEQLPQPYKLCFLYMGAFPQKYEVSLSKLCNLWKSEGCINRIYDTIPKWIAERYFLELESRNLVMICRKTYKGGIKTCRFHSIFWYLSNREARKNKFFYALNSHADSLTESTKSERRLSIRNGILFGIKDVHNSMAFASNARSLLCTGPPHPYPVPIYLGLKLLRVLDALTIRFYDFPIGVLELDQLKYLALTYNGKLPSSISKLWNLEFLMIRQHYIIRSQGILCYLPMEIWDMEDLKHLQIMGSSLQNPNGGVLLENLKTLLDVSAQSCTEGVLENVPNLEKLGIRIEFSPEAAEGFSSFNHILHLRRLRSLKCVVVNPEFAVGTQATPCPMFPSGLTKLTLSGFGYPWEDMRIIGELEYLKVLKLQCYAFQGPDWKTYEGEFKQLKHLLLEDTDLVFWKAENVYFPCLECLVFRHCYKLKEIPSDLLASCTVKFVDCNAELETKWKKIEL